MVERDFRAPEALEQGEGASQLWLKRNGHMSCYSLDHHPFDVVGWDGTVYPVAFSIHDFEAPGCVICSLVPRQLAGDPEAASLPYHHSNVDRDSVRYRVEGKDGCGPGVQPGSFTHHVGGLAHGPQPGTAPSPEGQPATTDELVVMLETSHPLHRTQIARQVVDTAYPFSWHDGGTRGSGPRR